MSCWIPGEHGVVVTGLQVIEPKLKSWCCQLGKSPSFTPLLPRTLPEPTHLPSPSLILTPWSASDAPHTHQLSQINRLNMQKPSNFFCSYVGWHDPKQYKEWKVSSRSLEPGMGRQWGGDGRRMFPPFSTDELFTSPHGLAPHISKENNIPKMVKTL